MYCAEKNGKLFPLKKENTPIISIIQLVWHNQYSTYKKIYQAFCAKNKTRLFSVILLMEYSR